MQQSPLALYLLIITVKLITAFFRLTKLHLFPLLMWSQLTFLSPSFTPLSLFLSLTFFLFLFSHSAALSSSLQKTSGLSSLPSVCPICDAVWAAGLIAIGRQGVGPHTRQRWAAKTEGGKKNKKKTLHSLASPSLREALTCSAPPCHVCHAA